MRRALLSNVHGDLEALEAVLRNIDLRNDHGAGIEEILESGAVVVVEWGDRLPGYLRRGALAVRFEELGEDARRIELCSDPAEAWMEDA